MSNKGHAVLTLQLGHGVACPGRDPQLRESRHWDWEGSATAIADCGEPYSCELGCYPIAEVQSRQQVGLEYVSRDLSLGTIQVLGGRFQRQIVSHHIQTKLHRSAFEGRFLFWATEGPGDTSRHHVTIVGE
jgi:hypothetical protein